MSNNKNFFEAPQAAAIYKHRLIRSYIAAWAGKVGSTAQGRCVHVYDAYSGPGRYEDDQPGSPELLVNTAKSMAELRSVFTVFSEKDEGYRRRLNVLMTDKGIDPSTYKILPGPVEDHVGSVLDDAAELPLFVFLDPYGLTLPFDQVLSVLTSRDRDGLSPLLQPKSELLMNFSYEAIRRISGVVRSDKQYAAKPAQIDTLNSFLGGTWWQQLARDQLDGWVEKILLEYARRVARATRFHFITAEVADSLESKPVYELILFTRHTDGIWEMIQSMSMARKDWRQWLVEAKERANGGQVEMRGLDFDDNEDAWVDEIAANIETLLDKQPGLKMEEDLSALFGRTLGLARETHVRKALNKLHKQSVIAAVPKGHLQRAYIARN